MWQLVTEEKQQIGARKIVQVGFFFNTLLQLTCELWLVSPFRVKKLLSKLSTFIILDKNAIIYYMWVLKCRQLLYTQKN